MNSRQVILGWIILGVLATSANAHAGRVDDIMSFLGWARKAKPTHTRTPEVRQNSAHTSYDEAVKRGDILPHEFPKAQDKFNQHKY